MSPIPDRIQGDVKGENSMTSMIIGEEVRSHESVLDEMVKQSARRIAEIAESIVGCFKRGNTVLLCGNGGSAADAQHVAAEFVNRFRIDRGALPAIALSTDASILTSIANDSSFDQVFSRQVEALARKGDILVGISTSGRSANVLQAVEAAHALGAMTIGFTGERGKDTLGVTCDYCLIVPSHDTARIQECHEFAWHVICRLVEQAIFPAAQDQKSIQR